MSAICLTDRCIRCLADIGEHGLLETPDMHCRHFPNVTERRCRQKLTQFAVAGFIQTIRLAISFAEKGGRIRSVHCLTERGADVVEERTGDRPKRPLKSDPRPETFHHRLQIVKTRLKFDSDCERFGVTQPDWIMEFDTRDDAPKKALPRERLILYHPLTLNGKAVACFPDAASVIKEKNLAVLWEIDRGTEGLAQIRGKIRRLKALLDQQAYTRYWGHLQNPTIRVFWVCPSKKRIRNIAAEAAALGCTASFRFATSEDCNLDMLTEPIWYDAKEDGYRSIFRKKTEL